MYGCKSWTVKKAEHRRIDAFELWCWRRLLKVPWTARRSNLSILKKISPGCSLEGLMLKLQLQYFGHLIWLIGKDPDAGRYWGQEEKGMPEDEMAGWHHRLDGREFQWTPGVGDGQGGLACCNSWGRKESDVTEWLNWTNDMWSFAGSSKKQESSRKSSISALLTMPKPLTVWITINCGKFWRRWKYQSTWPASWETCMQVRKQPLELDMEQQTGSK